MPKHTRVLTSLVGSVVLFAAPLVAHAHQQWLLPNFFVSDSKDDSVWLGFEHALGDRRFIPSAGPGPAQLWVTGPNDEWTSPKFVYTGKTRTVAEIELEKPGTYKLAAEEPEAHWTRLVEGKKKRWVRTSRDRVVGKKFDMSKRYWAKAIAYVTFRTQTQGPLAAAGDPLELVPLDHPNAAVAGPPFRLRVLAAGAPLASASLKVYGEATEGHDPTMTLKSDTDGHATIKFPKPGRYLISVRHEVPAKDDPKADAYSYSVHLMIDVASRSRK